MLSAEARVETERSSRYLVQLCRHFNDEAQAHPEEQVHVEWSDDRGVASFGWGRCTLRAAPGALTLRAEAPDEENLQRVQHLVADHLERFGRRDHLTVTWTPPSYPDSNGDTGVGIGRGSRTSRPRWVKVFGIILVKFGIIALVLVLFRGLWSPLVAGHGAALLVLLVAAAVTLSVYKLRGVPLHPALSRRPPRGHRSMVARILKNKGGK